MANKPTVYQFRVSGHLEKRWELWFDDLTIANHAAPDGALTTTLTGPVGDQAALYGILARLRDLGVTLLSVQSWTEP